MRRIAVPVVERRRVLHTLVLGVDGAEPMRTLTGAAIEARQIEVVWSREIERPSSWVFAHVTLTGVWTGRDGAPSGATVPHTLHGPGMAHLPAWLVSVVTAWWPEEDRPSWPV